MCTYCGQHCVEDEFFRLSKKELESGTRVPENICPDKRELLMSSDDDGGGTFIVGQLITERDKQ